MSDYDTIQLYEANSGQVPALGVELGTLVVYNSEMTAQVMEMLCAAGIQKESVAISRPPSCQNAKQGQKLSRISSFETTAEACAITGRRFSIFSVVYQLASVLYADQQCKSQCLLFERLMLTVM